MRSPSPTALALAAVTVVAACHIGPNVASYPPANSPFGTTGTYEVGTTTFEAELLAVRDSSFVVLRDQHVVLVPFDYLESASFPHVSVEVNRTQRPTAAELAQLRVLSRFPQGLSGAVERKLLDGYGQTEPILVVR